MHWFLQSRFHQHVHVLLWGKTFEVICGGRDVPVEKALSLAIDGQDFLLVDMLVSTVPSFSPTLCLNIRPLVPSSCFMSVVTQLVEKHHWSRSKVSFVPATWVDIVTHRSLDEIIWVHDHCPFLKYDVFEARRQIDILIVALERGVLEIVQWIYQQSTCVTELHTRHLNAAIKSGNVHVAVWFHQKINEDINFSTTDEGEPVKEHQDFTSLRDCQLQIALETNNADMVDFVLSRINEHTRMTAGILSYAVGSVDIFRRLCRQFYPVSSVYSSFIEDIVNECFRRHYVDVETFKWLFDEYSIPLDNRQLLTALQYNHLNIAIWMTSRSNLPQPCWNRSTLRSFIVYSDGDVTKNSTLMEWVSSNIVLERNAVDFEILGTAIRHTVFPVFIALLREKLCASNPSLRSFPMDSYSSLAILHDSLSLKDLFERNVHCSDIAEAIWYCYSTKRWDSFKFLIQTYRRSWEKVFTKGQIVEHLISYQRQIHNRDLLPEAILHLPLATVETLEQIIQPSISDNVLLWIRLRQRLGRLPTTDDPDINWTLVSFCIDNIEFFDSLPLESWTEKSDIVLPLLMGRTYNLKVHKEQMIHIVLKLPVHVWLPTVTTLMDLAVTKTANKNLVLHLSQHSDATPTLEQIGKVIHHPHFVIWACQYFHLTLTLDFVNQVRRSNVLLTTNLLM